MALVYFRTNLVNLRTNNTHRRSELFISQRDWFVYLLTAEIPKPYYQLSNDVFVGSLQSAAKHTHMHQTVAHMFHFVDPVTRATTNHVVAMWQRC